MNAQTCPLSGCQSAGPALNPEPRRVTLVGRRRDVSLATGLLTRSGTSARLAGGGVRPLDLWRQRTQSRTARLARRRLPASASLLRTISAEFHCPALDRRGWAGSVAPAQAQSLHDMRAGDEPEQVPWASGPAVSPCGPPVCACSGSNEASLSGTRGWPSPVSAILPPLPCPPRLLHLVGRNLKNLFQVEF